MSLEDHQDCAEPQERAVLGVLFQLALALQMQVSSLRESREPSEDRY